MTDITKRLPLTLSPSLRDGRLTTPSGEGEMLRRERVDDEWWLTLDDYVGGIEEDLQQEWAAFETDDILLRDEFGEWDVL